MKIVSATCGREPLVDTIVRFVARERMDDTREIRACVERAIDESGPGAIDSLSARLSRAGTEKLFPIHGAALHAVPVTMSIGRPMPASELSGRFRNSRRLMMDYVGHAVADLLPPRYRGAYGSRAD